MGSRMIAPGLALAAALACFQSPFDPNDGATTSPDDPPPASTSGGASGAATVSTGPPPDGESTSAPDPTATASTGTTLGDGTEGPPPVDPPPTVEDFAVSPELLELAGPAHLDAVFSRDVVAVDLLELLPGDGDEKTELVLEADLAPSDFPLTYPILTAEENGARVFRLRVRDAIGQVAESNTDDLQVLLPPSGAPLDLLLDGGDIKAEALAVAPYQGGAAIVGVRDAGGTWAAFARRYDGKGARLWTVPPIAGVAHATGVAVGPSDALYVVGNRAVGGSFGMYLARVDPSGHVTPLAAAGPGTWATGVVVDDLGRIYISGYVADPDYKTLSHDVSLWAFKADGSSLYQRTWEHPSEAESLLQGADDRALAIARLLGGDLALVGESAVPISPNNTLTAALILRFAPSGHLEGERLHLSATHRFGAAAVATAADGPILVAGWSRPAKGGVTTPALLVLDPDLALLHGHRDLEGQGPATAVAALPGGRALLATHVQGGLGLDILLRAYARDSGAIAWDYVYKGPAGDDRVYALTADPYGIATFAGSATLGGVPRPLVGKVHP